MKLTVSLGAEKRISEIDNVIMNVVCSTTEILASGNLFCYYSSNGLRSYHNVWKAGHCMREEVRLNKYLAECGVCSRRDADKLISSGRVTVNGEIAGMGIRVSGADEVTVDGKTLHGRDEKVVLAYYKPIGVTCTEKDKFAGRLVTEEIGYPVRVTYAGRLDRDSEGLLLLSNDGDLIQRMMKGSAGHEKEYTVRVRQEITEGFLEKMAAGVYLKELDVRTRPCRIWQKGKYTFHIVLTQGLNRQIRRMCGELSMDVVSLKRIRVINITLEGLKPGEYRIIGGEEKAALYRAAETAGNGR